jgi:16S rRNA (guanine(966)-N(2))-methyltransferase RsmD
MKIISSSSRRGLRPTTSKVREAVFNILFDKIRGARFLDLYAGTGAIGLEALSRGASEVFFVEANKNYIENIKQVVQKRGLSEKTNIFKKTALSFIKWAKANHLFFDIIFMDPPYHTDEIVYALNAIDSSRILREEGIVIAEHFKKRHLPEKMENLQKVRDYSYGDTVLSLYKKESK